MTTAQVYIFRWGKYRPELKGRRCTVEARGKMNSCKVKWLDHPGFDIVSRNAIRKAKP